MTKRRCRRKRKEVHKIGRLDLFMGARSIRLVRVNTRGGGGGGVQNVVKYATTTTTTTTAAAKQLL
jgi:hypothetical protein